MPDADRARLLARIGGVLYLAIIAIGASGELLVRGSIVVPGDATATVANLRSMEWLWRLGVAGEVVLLSCALSLTLIFYVLLRPVNRTLAQMAVLFNLVSIAIEAVAAGSLAGTLHATGTAPYLSAFSPDQLGAMAMLSVRAHTTGFAVALIFFGFECLILGYLIRRSTYLPWIIGVLMQVAGACYAINSFAVLLSPPLASRLFPLILMPSLVAELTFALWLLIKGVRVEKWPEPA